MATLKELVSAIENRAGAKKIWSRSRWQAYLHTGVRGWEGLVQDPANWPAIEKARPPKGLDDLCHLFVSVAGPGLATRWFSSPVEEQAKAAREWLRDVDNLNVVIWRQLNDEIKEYVIYYCFDQHDGQPFETWRRMAFDRPRRLTLEIAPEMVIPSLPITGYIPSREVNHIRSLAQRSGDQESVRLIDRLIAERGDACRIGASRQDTRVPYTLTRDERELVARIMDRARQGGFRPAPLPDIYLSVETPPIFVAYPELEEEGDEGQEPKEREEVECGRVPRNRQRGHPEVMTIEEVLGCYIPNPRIVLYARGLRWLAKRRGFDEDMLRAVVLVHEVGHWVTHLLPKPGVPEWPLELYKLTEEDVHEGSAQLITWWIAEEVGGDFRRIFEELNRSQSPPYRVFERFKGNAVGSVVASFERLRQLRWPARLKDWEHFCL